MGPASFWGPHHPCSESFSQSYFESLKLKEAKEGGERRHCFKEREYQKCGCLPNPSHHHAPTNKQP